jgi:hypothetical protein
MRNSLLAAVAMVAAPLTTIEADPFRINVMLCDTPKHAIAYTVAINNGATEEEAKDTVGKQAGGEVCGKFFGFASVDQQRTVTEKGITYEVISYEFSGVGDIRWSAIPQN